MSKDILKLKLEAPRFTQYEPPDGFLLHEPGCHALWYYYLIARNVYETHVKDAIVYEGERDPEFNFKQMFTSVALAYNTQPEVMVKFWKNVDMQCWQLRLPKLPDEEKYRFNTVMEVRTQ